MIEIEEVLKNGVINFEDNNSNISCNSCDLTPITEFYTFENQNICFACIRKYRNNSENMSAEYSCHVENINEYYSNMKENLDTEPEYESVEIRRRHIMAKRMFICIIFSSLVLMTVLVFLGFILTAKNH